ncbi:MAG: molybdopterin-dependent oxidoreductase [Casimicrobiaceae bacterium]
MSTLTSTHWGTYRVEQRDGRPVALHPFEHDRDPSPIGQSIIDSLHAPCRVRRPAIRRGFLRSGPASRDLRGRDQFVEVPWDEALDVVARELRRVIDQHGNDAIFGGSYGWASAGRFHHAQGQIHRFLGLLGGYTSKVDTYSLAAGRVVLPHVLMAMDPLMTAHTSWPVLERHCRLFVAFGGLPTRNSQVNAGGASQHDVRHWLQRLHRAGVKFVNVSPLRADMDGVPAAEWHPIRPNTDTAVMLALAHVLITRDLVDRKFIADHTVGYDRFRDYVLGVTDGQPKDAAWAGAISEMPASSIEALALEMAATRTMINASWSVQRADHGEQPFWMATTLAALLGQIGLPGGGLGFGYAAVNGIGAHVTPFSGPRLAQGVHPMRSYIPVARISDMLLNPGAAFEYNGRQLAYPDIRLVYWAGGNPFHHHQDINKLVRAWRRPETIIAHEQFWTPHAKFSDIVLPVTVMLERDDIGSAANDRFMIAMKRVSEPHGEARDDYGIFAALAERLGTRAAFTEGRSVDEWLRYLYDGAKESATTLGLSLPDFDTFWANGYVEHPVPLTEHVLLEQLRADPVAHGLGTPSQKIEIYSATIAGFGYDDCPGHPVWLEPAEWLGSPLAERFPLHLLSNQPATRLHSQYDHGALSRASKIQGREPVLLNSEDAADRAIAAGDVVRVFNDRGACLAGAVLRDDLRRGVAIMATGAWYDPQDPGEIGTLCKHGNANVLTRDVGSSRLAQGCSAQTALVEVERFAGVVAPVTAFDPPVFVER